MTEVPPSVTSRADRWLKAWIGATAVCIVAGWGLSAIGQLNAVGYLITALVCAGVLFLRASQTKIEILRLIRNAFSLPRLRRFRKPLPLLFLSIAAMAFLGGAIHPPNNYDALTYRFPRVLHWAALNHWGWIATPNFRMNISAANFEWLMTPLYLLTKSDRLFFLINFVPFLFLPGLIFAVFRRLGLSGRAAWNWMWILPAGFCYALQAGSIGNDSISAAYFLAVIYWALRAKETGNLSCLWLWGLSIGLLTGVKSANLPLLLPCLVAAWPALPLLRKKIAATSLVFCVVLAVSFAPSAILNLRFTGHWSGDLEDQALCQIKKPVAGLIGNSVLLISGNCVPPIFPMARKFEGWVAGHVSDTWMARMEHDFPRFQLGPFNELPQEERAGLGLAIVALVGVSFAPALVFFKGKRRPSICATNKGILVGLATWGACLFYMTHVGSEAAARLLAAYYPLLLLPLLLHSGSLWLVRRRWWRWLAALCVASALPGMLLSPSRPLFPAETILQRLASRFPGNQQIMRAQKVYAVYGARNDLLGSLRSHIPKNVGEIGLIAGEDDMEVSLWRPFGKRRVTWLSGQACFRPPVEWIVVSEGEIAKIAHSRHEWLSQVGGEVVSVENIVAKAGGSEEKWLLVHAPAKSEVTVK